MATQPPPQLELAGAAYWPIKGTVPRAKAISGSLNGVTYTAVAEAVNSTFIDFKDGAAPGVDPVQAIVLSLNGGGFWVYDPITEELARAVGYDRAMWIADPTFIRIEVDRPMTTAAGTAVQLVWPTTYSVSLKNVGATTVAIGGAPAVPVGVGTDASGFAETGMIARATSPITYNATGGSLLISVNP